MLEKIAFRKVCMKALVVEAAAAEEQRFREPFCQDRIDPERALLEEVEKLRSQNADLRQKLKHMLDDDSENEHKMLENERKKPRLQDAATQTSSVVDWLMLRETMGVDIRIYPNCGASFTPPALVIHA